jgi:hypothetical protein
MSQNHTPPRQNVHRGRAPVTKPRAAKGSLTHTRAANAAFNDHMAQANKAAAKATPGQLVGAGIKLS